MAGWHRISGALKQISVGDREFIWGVNQEDQIFQIVGGKKIWRQVPGALKWVSVGMDGTVWGVNAAGNIYRYNDDDKWTKIPGALTQISVGASVFVWGVNDDGNIYMYTGDDTDPWKQIPGKLSNVSVGTDGTVWGVNAKGRVFRFDGEGTETWTEIIDPNIGGITKKLTQVSVGSANNIWAVDAEGDIFRYTGIDDHPWVQHPGEILKNISVAADGTIWGVNPNNEIYRFYRSTDFLVSNGKLLERNLESSEEGQYQFLFTNTTKNTTFHHIEITLAFDQPSFVENGITVSPNLLTIDELAPGYSTALKFSIITNNAAPGPYGIYGVDANSQETTVHHVDIADDEGWLNFDVVED